MRYHRLLLLTALIAGARPLAAQGGFLGVTSIELSTPLGDTKHFVDTGLGAGLGWEGRWTVNSHTSAGFGLVFSEFSQHEDGTMQFPSGAVTGNMLRQLFSQQLLATGYFFPGGRGQVRYYAGGGIGATQMDQNVNLGTQLLSKSAWHFTLAPEIGAEIRSHDGFLVGVVALRYNGAMAAGDYVGGGSRHFQNITLRFGFGEQ